MLDSPLEQPLSRSSLVFPLVLNPQLNTPCISSPNHHLFAAHAHTNAACSAAISNAMSSTPSLSLSSLLGSLSCSLMPHIHLTIMIRYDTRCYFNVRSKADISQLNLPHGTGNKKSVKTEKKQQQQQRPFNGL